MYYASKTYAAHYGPGGEGLDIPHTRKVTIKAEDLDLCMEHIMDVNNVQKLACGTKPLVLSNGTTLVVPAISRYGLRDHLWSEFKKKYTDGAGVYTGGVSRTDFLTITNCATKNQQKTYAALDQIKVRCGSENFQTGRQLLRSLISMEPSDFAGYEQSLIPLLNRYEEHCKTGLPKHLSTTSKVACHCAHHLFGGQNDYSSTCGPECSDHPDRCKECDAGRFFIHALRFETTHHHDTHRTTHQY